MKKAILVSIVLCLCSILVIGTFGKYKEVTYQKTIKQTIEEAEVINANSSMGVEYLEFTGLSEESAKQLTDDNPGAKGTADGYVSGVFFKIPADSIDRRMTQINITGGDYHIFGIRVGDNLEQGSKVLMQNGYQKIKPVENINGNGMLGTRFQKAFVLMELKTDIGASIIKELTILTLNPRSKTLSTPEEVWRETVQKAMLFCVFLCLVSIIIIVLFGKHRKAEEKKAVEKKADGK